MKLCHTYVMALIVCVAALAGCASTRDKGQVQQKVKSSLNELGYASTRDKGQVQQQQMMPPNAESEYLKTVSVGIIFNGNVTPTEISYAITLKVRKPLPENAIVVLKFENPNPRAAPVEVVHEPKPDQKEISVVSPSVACIVNGRHYRVAVTLFADREQRDILGTHEQMVAFFSSPMILRTLSVPECPPTEQGSSGDPRNLPQTNKIIGVRAERLPIWNIDLPRDEDWDVAHTYRKDRIQVIEYTAGGEKLESWSQRISYSYIPLPKEEFQDEVKFMLSRIETDCSSPKSQILAKSEYMVVFRWAGEGCGGLPPLEGIARFEYVDAGLTVLKYTYLKRKATPDFEAWIRRVIEAKVEQRVQ